MTELLVALAILGIGIMGSVSAFKYIAGSTQHSKARTLASNLAQEKMQILKQQSYYKLLVTTNTAYDTSMTPVVAYDTAYYPPESVLEGSISFQRLTLVQVVRENSGQIVVLPPTTPDTGMKMITVTVVWRSGAEFQKLQLNTVESNPDTVMSNSTINGRVRNASSLSGLSNARVNVAENVGWQDTANGSGDFTVNLSPGNYNLIASAEGYYSQLVPISISANQTLTQNFDLVQIASGSVRGSVWVNDHLVISQVVGSSETPVGSGFYQEYVEVFNPTTWTWTVNGGGMPDLDLKYQHASGALTTIPIVRYNTSSILPGHYFLMANTGTVSAVGVGRTADAEYSGNYIEVNGLDPTNDAAAVGLANRMTGEWVDVVGWSKGATLPPFYEGAVIVQTSFGLEDDEQFVRRSSTAGVMAGFARAYDSGNNNIDFMQDGRHPMIYPPRNSSDSADAVIAGVPAVGAVVSATDGLSNPATAYITGNPPYAEFILPGVATGTYFVSITSNSRLLEIDNVAVTANATTWVPNASTLPAWPSVGRCAVILSSAATQGFISGRVTNVTGSPISPSIVVRAGSLNVTTNAQGYYTIDLPTGTYSVTANPDNANAGYIAQELTGVSVHLGEVTSNINFVLSQGGKLQAKATRDGINALPGVAIAAYDVNGIVRDEEVSGADGRVLLSNLSTGTYTLQPVLDSGETSTPLSFSGAVTSGNTVFVGTFTISGAFGAVTGSVRKSGQPIRSGVLVIVSTGTSVSNPPTLSSSTLTSAPLYMASSLEDGTYRVDIRGSTSTVYSVSGFYYTFNGATPVLSSTAVQNVSVLPGLTTSGVDFSW